MNNLVKTLITCSFCGIFTLGINEPARTQSLSLGQEYQGGFIFFIDSTGQHGLISASIDLGRFPLIYRTEWKVEGADGVDIGTGARNTFNIIRYTRFQGGTAPYYCATLVHNGYTDWFLPSIDELDQISMVRKKLGYFKDGFYWSSTIAGQFYGWAENFATGETRLMSPYSYLNVRPIRAF